eukprot:3488581-Prorocentrum_lima.AAC.1
MIEVIAQKRMGRALSSKTRAAVQLDDYHIGDIVELYRNPANKEVSGWRGPATIVHVDTDGTIH